MPHYILRNIPDELWTEAKGRATREGRTLRQILIDLIRYYVTHGIPPFQRVLRTPPISPPDA